VGVCPSFLLRVNHISRPLLSPADLRVRAFVDSHIAFVTRVLRRAGTPRAEIDDEVQRTFIVATRRLDDIHPGAERGFLFRTALNLAAHAKRRATRRREVDSDQAAEQVERLATPEALTDQKMTRALLNGVIEQMNATWRATFVLYELEEMSMTEVADTLGIPRGTVASRLRGARNEFRARLAAIAGFGAVAVRSRSAP
jgi:RNA polymerase sigma-70 factor (ECF subfamily)